MTGCRVVAITRPARRDGPSLFVGRCGHMQYVQPGRPWLDDPARAVWDAHDCHTKEATT